MKLDLTKLHCSTLPEGFLDAKLEGRAVVKGYDSNGILVEETALPVYSTVREILAETASYLVSSNVAVVQIIQE